MDIKKQEIIDHCNKYLEMDPELITKVFTAYIAVNDPSLLQSDPITFKRGNDTVITLQSAMDTMHQSGERVRVIIKNGLITKFF